MAAAAKKKSEVAGTGGGPPTANFTPAEELALDLNKGRPVIEGIEGGTASGSIPSSIRDHYLKVMPNSVCFLDPPDIMLNPVESPSTVEEDEETVSVCSRRPEFYSPLVPHRPYDCAIDLLPAAKFIRPSSSPAGAGFFFVGKKDGSLRPCIDYRGLNNITVKNTYPLPLMSSAFERLQGASIFTKLDLRNTYHLVRIREGDEWKTAFNTPRGHFEYLVMPFGFSNSPAFFQALVNDVLRDMIDQFIYVYLDDILIFSSSLQEHVQHVRRVLQRLLENGLFVKAEKCNFHAQSVPFLGYIVSSEGMRIDPEKVDWPSPDSRKALLRFLGFANFYRRFIRNFSQLVAPLTALTSPRTAFRWSDSAEAVFTKLKGRFVSAPILITPDSSRQFVVEVEASEVGVGAVLSQRSPVDDKMHPCAFFSHRLSSAERNYDIGNRELLAVKLALEEWRHWLEGSGNIKPDSLSRIFDFSERLSTPECILPETIFVSALTWEIEAKFKRALEGVTPPPGCPPNRLFVLEGLRSDVIQWGHSSNFVPLVSLPIDPSDGLLQPVPSRPWSHIALDFIPALPPSQGNTVVLTVVDRFSKAAHFIPLPKLPLAKETAVTIVNHVFRLHGLPIDVVSDRGPQFVSKFWREFCKLLGATVSLSSGFHPQSNGQTERANQDLERTLRCLVSKNPSSWSQQLSMVEYAHNTLPVSSTGLSPFECSVGYQPPIFPSLESEVAVPSAHAFIQRCHRTSTRARETLLQVGAHQGQNRSPPVQPTVQEVSVPSSLALHPRRQRAPMSPTPVDSSPEGTHDSSLPSRGQYEVWEPSAVIFIIPGHAPL
ncbi:retrotransposable element [Pimephales promelas]|nr:retrotransposable element [Pimephales promelas]